LFNAPALAGKIAFRGGTAIHKLLFKQPLRYSEDIDLVQTQAEPIGPTVDAIRDALAWLGKCNREQAGHSMHLVFRFAPESAPQATLKLKVEINTREHEALLGYRRYPFAMSSDWYSAQAELVSFEPEELFGTKLRALLQRRKNRDLFDLHHGLTQLGLDRDKVVTCLNHYMALEDHPISRAEAEERMLKKLTRSLTEDIEPLLPVGVDFDETVAIAAFNDVWSTLIARLRGGAWKLSAEVVAQLRATYPRLLT
jgi:predicted nucleotidyltransferase component of viral defense system